MLVLGGGSSFTGGFMALFLELDSFFLIIFYDGSFLILDYVNGVFLILFCSLVATALDYVMDLVLFK